MKWCGGLEEIIGRPVLHDGLLNPRFSRFLQSDADLFCRCCVVTEGVGRIGMPMLPPPC